MSDTLGRPAFVLTVDVEGDNVWARGPSTTVENLRRLPRLHQLCVEYGVRPVYLASFDVSASDVFGAFIRDVVGSGEGELGMHLHAWSSPPAHALDHARPLPFATRYLMDALRAKVRHLTAMLATLAGIAPTSHRGGRWALDATYARVLVEEGYLVDTSVTPGLSWRGTGVHTERLAPDYSTFPVVPYFVDLQHIERPGMSPLLEVPLTTRTIDLDRSHADGRPARIVEWLRPTGRNGASLVRVAHAALAEGRPCLVAMLHSSDLLPGGSPVARDAEAVERVVADLRRLFEQLRGRTSAMTLAEYRRAFAAPTEVA